MKGQSEAIDLNTDGENGATPAGETRDEASAELTPPPRPRVSLPERPDSRPEMPGGRGRSPDQDSRPEMPGERGHSPDQLDGAEKARSNDGKILVIGREIVLSGKIASCDRLVVEGQVEAKMKDCREIEIAETGTFKGQVEFDRADISGIFEGDLTARDHLVVRATGCVNGKVRFGELEIERGGKVIGDVQVFGEGAPAGEDGGIAVDKPAK